MLKIGDTVCFNSGFNISKINIPKSEKGIIHKEGSKGQDIFWVKWPTHNMLMPYRSYMLIKVHHSSHNHPQTDLFK